MYACVRVRVCVCACARARARVRVLCVYVYVCGVFVSVWESTSSLRIKPIDVETIKQQRITQSLIHSQL